MPSAITRRQLLLSTSAMGLGLVAGCGRLPWQAEAPARVPHVGVLSLGSADPSDADNAAFRQGLRDLGYAEGQNIALEWRAPNGDSNQYPALAADLVGRPVDVIVTQGTAPALAATHVVHRYSPRCCAQHGTPGRGRQGGDGE